MTKPLKNKDALYQIRNEALIEYFKLQVEYQRTTASDKEKQRREILSKRDVFEETIRAVDRVMDEMKRGSYHYPIDIRTEE